MTSENESTHGGISCTRDDSHDVGIDRSALTCFTCNSSTEKWCRGCQKFFPTSTFDSFHTSHVRLHVGFSSGESDSEENKRLEPMFTEISLPSAPNQGSINADFGDETDLAPPRTGIIVEKDKVEVEFSGIKEMKEIDTNDIKKYETTEIKNAQEAVLPYIRASETSRKLPLPPKKRTKIETTKKLPPKKRTETETTKKLPPLPKKRTETEPKIVLPVMNKTDRKLVIEPIDSDDFEEEKIPRKHKGTKLLTTGENLVSLENLNDESLNMYPRVENLGFSSEDFLTRRKLEEKKQQTLRERINRLRNLRKADEESSSEESSSETEGEDDSEDYTSTSSESESSESSDEEDEAANIISQEMEKVKKILKDLKQGYKKNEIIEFTSSPINTIVESSDIALRSEFRNFRVLLYKEIRMKKIPKIKSKKFQSKTFALMRIYDPSVSRFRILKNPSSTLSPIIFKSLYYSSRWFSNYKKFKVNFQAMYREMNWFSKGFPQLVEAVAFQKIKNEFFERSDFLYILPLLSHKMKFDIWNTIGVIYVLITSYEGMEFVHVGKAEEGIDRKFFNGNSSQLQGANRIGESDEKLENNKIRIPSIDNLVFRLGGSNSYLFVVGDFKNDKYCSVNYWIKKYRKLSLQYQNCIVVNDKMDDHEVYTFSPKK